MAGCNCSNNSIDSINVNTSKSVCYNCGGKVDKQNLIFVLLQEINYLKQEMYSLKFELEQKQMEIEREEMERQEKEKKLLENNIDNFTGRFDILDLRDE